MIHDAALEVAIKPVCAKRYELIAAGRNANLTATVNPAPVTPTSGGSGIISVTAQIFR